jgi:hypothetical protein
VRDRFVAKHQQPKHRGRGGHSCGNRRSSETTDIN